MRILLVEDEKRMAMAEVELLRQEGYEVTHCQEGLSGEREAMSGRYDVIILDIMLPGKSGLEILENLRQEGSNVPVLLLTAKSQLEDKVEGLDAGADDYLTKPFAGKELLARVRALGRRRDSAISMEETSHQSATLTAESLELNTENMTIRDRNSGESIRLSEKEYFILETLMRNYGRIVTREQLAVKVWGYENEAEYNNIEVYISFTRKKLKFIKTGMEIKAVRGVGYELRLKEE